MNANGAQLFVSPQDAGLDNYDIDYTPDLDYLDGDSGFDFENADLGGEMIGALPGRQSSLDDGHGHEKRKSRDEYDDEKGDAKRQETQEGEKSGAKKPGRKPLTSEPTTVCRSDTDPRNLTLTDRNRNARRRTEPHSVLSVNARSST
jgi:AP-1-like factor